MATEIVKVNLGAQAAETAPERQELPALVSARRRLEAARARATAAEQALAADRTSDEAQAAEIDREAIDAEQLAQKLEHDREGEKVYRAECRRRGSARVALVRTPLGPVVMRPMTETEDDDLSMRQKDLEGLDVYRAAIDATLETVLYPPAATVRAWLAEYPGLGVEISNVRIRLIYAKIDDARGKA